MVCPVRPGRNLSSCLLEWYVVRVYLGSKEGVVGVGRGLRDSDFWVSASSDWSPVRVLSSTVDRVEDHGLWNQVVGGPFRMEGSRLYPFDSETPRSVKSSDTRSCVCVCVCVGVWTVWFRLHV